MGKFCPKVKIWYPKKFENAEFNVPFTFSAFRREIPFLTNFGSKHQSCQFKVKLATKTNSNMQNSMAVFTFYIFYQKYPFWVNLVQKVEIVSLS